MPMKSIAGYIAPFAAAVTVLLIALYARREPRVDGKVCIVEYGVPQKLVGALAVLTSLYLVVWGFSSGNERLFLRTALFLVLAGALAAHWWITQIRFDDHEIEVISPWRRKRVIPFSAILDVYAGVAGWKVQTRGHGSIRFNHLQRGWRRFRETLEYRARAER